MFSVFSENIEQQNIKFHIFRIDHDKTLFEINPIRYWILPSMFTSIAFHSEGLILW